MHKHEVIIRLAKPKDAPFIATLAHELAASEGRISDTSESSILDAAFSETAACRFLVVEIDEFVVGTVMFYGGYDLEHAQKGLHLGDIIITQPYQRQGLGTRLMHYLIYLARAEGYQWISWTVLPSNHAALAFYHKIGASEIKIRFMAMGSHRMDNLLAHASL